MNESKEAEDAQEKDYDVLPVIEFKDEIMSKVDKNPMIIVIGETGSGKTTQIPQFLLDSDGIWNRKMIAVTQPRRIAAITVAQRVADERKSALGSEIGYAVRFDDKTSEKTRVKYMTDGILVRECLSDKNLSQYSTIMLDEAHERSLNTDILFGLLKAAARVRKDLRIIITSATLDSEKFGEYFSNCPVIRVPGRIFPVDIYHSKSRQVMTASGPSNKSYIQSAVDVVMKIHRKDDSGHILVFLTGEDEIEKACSLIRSGCEAEGMRDRELLVLPLYSALSNEDQNKVFKSVAALKTDGKGNGKLGQNGRSDDQLTRKCVVSTNIAETSVTVPHVRFVVDAGYVKQKTFDPTRGMEALIVVPVSKTAALQRAGRAGRTASGQCYRLYSSECFSNMVDVTVPEIRRMNLSNTILYLKAIGVVDVLSFDFMDRPSQDQVVSSLVELHTLGALNDCGEITTLGRDMSQFPLEPAMSKVLVESVLSDNDCLREIIIIAAMLSVESIWYRPPRSKIQESGGDRSSHHQRQGAAGGRGVGRPPPSIEEQRMEEAHRPLRHAYGDYHTYLHVFQQWEEARCSYDWCQSNYINFRSMKTAKKVRDHLSADSSVAKLKKNSSPRQRAHTVSLDRRIANTITAGFFTNAAVQCANESVYKTLPLVDSNRTSSSKSRGKGRDEQGPTFRMVHTHPSSVFSALKAPEHVVFKDLTHSSKLFMKEIVRVDHRCLQYHQSRWRYVHPTVLSGNVLIDSSSSPGSKDGSSSSLAATKRERPLGLGERGEKEDGSVEGAKYAKLEDTSEAKGVDGGGGGRGCAKESKESAAVRLARERFLARKKQGR